MQKFRTLLLLLTVGAVVAACAGDPKEISNDEWEQQNIDAYLDQNYRDANIARLEGGSYVLLHTKSVGTGDFPQSGNYVKFDVVGRLLNGKKFRVTRKWDAQLLGTFSYATHYAPSYDALESLLPGINNALRSMQVGDSMIVLLPSAQAYGTAGTTGIGANTPVIFELVLRKIVPDPKAQELQEVQKIVEDDGNFAPVLDADGVALAGIYIKEIDMVPLSEETPYPGKDTALQLKYAGFYLDSFLLDTNIGHTAVAHNVYDATQTKWDTTFLHTYGYGDQNSIAAFDAGLRQVTAGSTVELIFTSDWGYGASGTTTIQPYTPLRFRIYRAR